jgi:hypothetical protein
MTHCSQRIGDTYFRTPRTTIKQFVHLLSILDQNPEVAWSDLIGSIPVEADDEPDTNAPVGDLEDSPDGEAPDQTAEGADDDLATFKL